MPHQTPLERVITAATELKTAQRHLQEAIQGLPQLKKNRHDIRIGTVIMNTQSGSIGEIDRIHEEERFGETRISAFEVKWDNGRRTTRHIRLVSGLILLKPAPQPTTEKTP